MIGVSIGFRPRLISHADLKQKIDFHLCFRRSCFHLSNFHLIFASFADFAATLAHFAVHIAPLPQAHNAVHTHENNAMSNNSQSAANHVDIAHSLILQFQKCHQASQVSIIVHDTGASLAVTLTVALSALVFSHSENSLIILAASNQT